jgi:hypothetical protein
VIGGAPAGPGRAGPSRAGQNGTRHDGAGPEAATVDGALGRLADWTARQSLGPTSLSGVSLTLAVCAAIWFTAGTRSDDRNGAIALGACYLAALGARHVAGRTRDYLIESLEQLARAGQHPTGTAAQRALMSARRVALAVRLRSIVLSGWLAILGVRLSDCAILAGLAAGAAAQGWPGMWPLAISVLALIAIRDTMTACSRPADPDSGAQDDREAGPLELVHRAVEAALTMPFGGRMLLLVVAVPTWGARAGMLGLLDWGIISVGYGIGAGTLARRRGRRHPAERRMRRTRSGPAGPGLRAVALEPPRPPEWAELHAARQLPVLGIRLIPAPPASPPAAGPDVPPAEPVGGLASIGLADAGHPDSGYAGAGLADVGYADGGYADSELAESGLLGPDLLEPDLADPDFFEPDLTEPGIAEPGLAEPGLFDPDLADPDLAGARLAPEAGEPESAEPQAAGPYAAGPQPAEPESAGRQSAGYELADPELAGTGPADPGLPVILRCRDDGAISRWFGRLVRGQLMPLPAALLALAGVAMLAHLGLGDLPGILIIAPAIVMLVAAPGSSHSHGGLLDWLVPAVLQGAQYIYITALGMAAGIPVAVTFLLCTAIALRYADLGCASSPPLPPRRAAQPAPARPAGAGPASTAPERATWMGWEGRMLICGLGAAMGIGMYAYLALAAYVGGLVCWKILTSSFVLREGDSR